MASPPPPRRRFPLFGVFGVLLAGVFLGSTCSTCASMQENEEGFFAPSGPRVGIVDVIGPIADARETAIRLARLSRQSDIEAVVVRVDSPGGVVGPSQEIYDAMRRTASVKPVVASMGAIAASGGFWIALAADEVFANPGTLTGSIGAIIETPDLRGLAELLRFDMRTYKSGPHKDIGNPFRAATEGDERIVQDLVDDVHDQFVSLTAERRNITRASALAVADGRIFTGREAKRLGLVDHLGGLEAAVRRASELAALRAGTSTVGLESPVMVFPPDETPPLLRMLGASLERAVSSGVERGVAGVGSGQVELR